METDTQVQEGQQTVGVEPAENQTQPQNSTPDQGGVQNQGTPSQPNIVDVESLKAKYERDINQLKSSLQRREAQVNSEWQKKYNELQRQMHEVRMSRMTDEERKAYEVQLQSEEMRQLQEQLNELHSERQTMAQMLDGMQFFIQQGVPADKLILSEGYDAMVRSGWEHITSELNRLRQAAANPQSQVKPEPAPLKPAPSVITDKGIPASGTTWEALRKQFGSDEAVYRAVEEGRINPSIIPLR